MDNGDDKQANVNSFFTAGQQKAPLSRGSSCYFPVLVLSFEHFRDIAQVYIAIAVFVQAQFSADIAGLLHEAA